MLRRNGRQARVYVVSVEANVVRLAFDAARDVEILREELLSLRSGAAPLFLPAVGQTVRHLLTVLWHFLR